MSTEGPRNAARNAAERTQRLRNIIRTGDANPLGEEELRVAINARLQNNGALRAMFFKGGDIAKPNKSIQGLLSARTEEEAKGAIVRMLTPGIMGAPLTGNNRALAQSLLGAWKDARQAQAQRRSDETARQDEDVDEPQDQQDEDQGEDDTAGDSAGGVAEAAQRAVEAGTAASIDEFVAAQENLTEAQRNMLKKQMDRLSKEPKNKDARNKIKEAFGADFLIVVLDVIHDMQIRHLTETIEKITARLDIVEKQLAELGGEKGVQGAGGVNVTLSNIGNIGAGAPSGGQGGAVPQAVPAGMPAPQAAQPNAFAQPDVPAQAQAPVQQQPPEVPAAPVPGAPEDPAVEPPAGAEGEGGGNETPETPETQNENHETQEAQRMLDETNGKLPLSIQSVLERKRGEMPTWKRVRNALGLMVLGGAAGAAVLATAGVPAALATVLAGSQLATFSAILTGAGSGLAAGGIAGAVRGVSDVFEARAYAKKEGLALGLNFGKVVSYLKGKTLRGGVYGAIGGGIAGGVMDTYGDDIRAAAGAGRDWLFSWHPGTGPITETPPPATCGIDALRDAAAGVAPIPDSTIDVSDRNGWEGPITKDGTIIGAGDEVVAAPAGGAPDVVAAPVEEPVIREDLEPVAAEPAPVEEVPEVPAAPAVDPALVDAFAQPVTNGGVWTAAERVTEAAGVAPGAGGGDLLTYLTDLAEDYTQDGSVDGTRATSYYRNYGEGLLNTMTSQAEVTQATIRNPINMAHLYANDNIYNDMLRRIAENSGLSGSEQELARETVEKLHEAAQVALER